MLESDLRVDVVNSLSESEKVDYINYCNEFWKFEGEDRDIVLGDLRKDEGILYKKMVDWNESELIVKLELNMNCWEYSLEDYFRDMFDKNERDGFGLFDLKDINKMMYGNDYEED